MREQRAFTGNPQVQGPLLGYFGRYCEVVLNQPCPACGKPVPLAAYQTREWLRLGPLPIFPLRSYRVFDDCPLCQHHRRLPLSNYQTWVAEQVQTDTEALAATPDDAPLRLELVWRLYGLGRLHEALALLAPEQFAGGGDADLQHAAGVILSALGRPEEARTALARAVELDPDDPSHHLDYARALANGRDQLALAEQHAQQACQLDSTSPEAWYLLGRIRVRRGNWIGADQAWHAMAERDPSVHQRPRLRAEMQRVKERAGTSSGRPDADA